MKKFIGVPFKPAEITELRATLEAQHIQQSRPSRQTVINSDDLLNLKIALESATSLDDFLGRV